MAFDTSTNSISSLGKKSNAVARLVVSSSAVGKRLPFIDAELAAFFADH